MLSTHFAEAHHLTEDEEIALDNHAAEIARLISDFLEIVQLRNHPGLHIAGNPSWPPLWTNTKRDGGKSLRGEIGILLKAYTTSDVTKICYLVIQYESDTYVGALLLEDAALCQQLCSMFQQNVARAISEIGSLELPYTL